MADAKHYVNNEKFLDALIERKKLVEAALAADKEKPLVSNYIGECIYMISKNLANRPNFIAYSYKDEMISDGIENALRYIDNFDPSKSKNPFAYYTQIIYYAFLRRIDSEKKQSYIKHSLVNNGALSFDVNDFDSAEDFAEFTSGIANNFFDDSFIKKKETKRKARARKTVETSIDLTEFMQ